MSEYQKLFNHMSEEHDLTLLLSEMQEIVRICRQIDRAEYEAMKADAERLNTLMDMSGEYYQESIKHQFVGRLREFIDLHSTAVKQAIDQERKQSEG